MVKWPGTARLVHRRFAWKLLTGAAIIALTSGCGRLSKKDMPGQRLAAVKYTQQTRPPLKPNNPLYIATSYWAKQHQKNPKDPKAALNYARNLKALGSKEKALSALARTYQLNRGNSELAAEYGRLALDLGQAQLAEPLLNQAKRARGRTDWRVLSALGTVNAKRGDHKKAQSYYMAALRQKPGASSVVNNLALSYALDGKAGDAEDLLKRAVAKGQNTTRIRQNLALVLGLQSKFSEAQKIAQADLATKKTENNKNFSHSMVKPTRLASSSGKARGSRTGAVTKTTASLPARKPAVKISRGAIRTPEISKNSKPGNTFTHKNTRPVSVASASKAVKSKPAANAPKLSRETVLPWRRKPAAPAKPKSAILAAHPPSSAPRATAKTKVAWNVTVKDSNSVKKPLAKSSLTKTSQTRTPAAKKHTEYSFPSGN